MSGISTSFHDLNADAGLSKLQRAAWIALNLANNSMPRLGADRRIVERAFRLSKARLVELWNDVRPDASPSRALCDLFWMSLDWSQLTRVLGPVHALEVGCGSGNYGRLLAKLLGENLVQYVGVDIEPHAAWKSEQDGRLAFKTGRAGDVDRFLPGANLIFTQSALEHFEEDLTYFRRVATYVTAYRRPVLQIHLVPTASCITTFPWHGIREYTPRTLSRITRLFGDDMAFTLYKLGGPACNRVHREFIVWPWLRRKPDRRKLDAYEYRASLLAALLRDFTMNSRSASFYAFVLASNLRAPVLHEN